ncbi:MAG TPA: zf-HC2 domain-containing protein [Acidimicrobiales bacterium]|nr:zf-HC2 domain-containing protein [Acidimicrobiales bacterium]
MTNHDDIRLSLGSYLTGALGPAARTEVDHHLHSCEGCRRELVELAALPGLLGRVHLRDPDAHPLAADRFGPGSLAPEAPPPPPEGLLANLLAEARRIEQRARRRARRLRVTAAVALLAAVVVASAALAARLAPAPGTSYRLHAEAASPRLAGEVTLLAKPWGTELELSLQGLPAGQGCQAVVTGVDGQRATIGDWSTTPDHAAQVEVASGLSPTELASLTVESASGAPLLGVRFTHRRPSQAR